jgi:GNAT superfamily N-acetyltransferase
MLWELEKDVPSPDPHTQEPMEEFEKVFTRPNFCAEGWFLAVDHGEPVGISMLGFSDTRADKMFTWLTGVMRSHRRQGIATAMKLCAIEFARGRDVRFIETGNEENNPMYQLNLMLGFKPKPAWLDFEKQLKDD